MDEHELLTVLSHFKECMNLLETLSPKDSGSSDHGDETLHSPRVLSMLGTDMEEQGSLDEDGIGVGEVGGGGSISGRKHHTGKNTGHRTA